MGSIGADRDGWNTRVRGMLSKSEEGYLIKKAWLRKISQVSQNWRWPWVKQLLSHWFPQSGLGQAMEQWWKKPDCY